MFLVFMVEISMFLGQMRKLRGRKFYRFVNIIQLEYSRVRKLVLSSCSFFFFDIFRFFLVFDVVGGMVWREGRVLCLVRIVSDGRLFIFRERELLLFLEWFCREGRSEIDVKRMGYFWRGGQDQWCNLVIFIGLVRYGYI